MKYAYPIIISRTQHDGFNIVFVPDFNINTQGKGVEDAIDMARDAIGLTGITYQDDGLQLPTPSNINEIKKDHKDDILTLVDIDFKEFRRIEDLRSVKKNCTLPAWLNYKAEKAGVNFSKLLQEAIKQELNL